MYHQHSNSPSGMECADPAALPTGATSGMDCADPAALPTARPGARVARTKTSPTDAKPVTRRRVGAKRCRAFTLVEALVCVALISGGIAICMTTLGAISRAQVRISDRETMQRLAVRKYDELVTTGTLTTGEANGDFAEIGITRFQWRADRSPSSVGNLDVLRVDVAPKGESYAHATEIQGLLSTAKASGS